MAIIETFHQFEIRFTPILNFQTSSRKIIAPYLSRTNSINIEWENTFKQRITLNFDNDAYSITFLWDRILFQTSVGIINLKNSNSIIEEPFFAIFSKIVNLEEFGQVINCLFFTVTANINIVYDNNRFKNDFLSDDLESILPFTDSDITLDQLINEDIIKLNFGPYIGIEDLQKRGIKYSIDQQNELSAEGGILADLKIVKVLNSISFKNYQFIFEESNSVLEKIWQRI